jgi:hypothetical protein
LGDVVTQKPIYKDFVCKPSEVFQSFNWCTRNTQEDGANGRFSNTLSALLSADGRAYYTLHLIDPAFFGPNEIDNEIKRLSKTYGQQPKILMMPPKAGLPNAVIVSWGDVALRLLDAESVQQLLAAGKSPGKGFHADFLGDFKRSAQEGLPVYLISGGPGMLWIANYDESGRGKLRLAFSDASKYTPRDDTPEVGREAPTPTKPPFDPGQFGANVSIPGQSTAPTEPPSHQAAADASPAQNNATTAQPEDKLSVPATKQTLPMPQPTPKVDAPSAPAQTQDLQGFSRQRAYEIGAKWKISPELIDDYVEHCGWRIGLFYNSPPGCKEYQAALTRNMDPHLKQYLELSINEIGQEKDEKARALEALAAKKRALDARIEQERAQAEAKQQQAAQQAELAKTQRKAEEEQKNKVEEEQKKRAMAESNPASHSMAGASGGCDNALTRSEHCNDTPPPPAVDYTHQPLLCIRPDVVERLTNIVNGPQFEMLRHLGGVTDRMLMSQIRTTSTNFPSNGVSCIGTMKLVMGPNGTKYMPWSYTVQMLDDGSDFIIDTH